MERRSEVLCVLRGVSLVSEKRTVELMKRRRWITFASNGHSHLSATKGGEDGGVGKVGAKEQVVEKQGKSEVRLLGKIGTGLLLLCAKGQECLVGGDEQGEVVPAAEVEGKCRGGSHEVGHGGGGRGDVEGRQEGRHWCWLVHG